jgi:hypothetical protein
LIKAKRDFDELDQLFNLSEKKNFCSGRACRVQEMHAAIKSLKR